MPELCRDQAPGYASVQCNYKHSASCVDFSCSFLACKLKPPTRKVACSSALYHSCRTFLAKYNCGLSEFLCSPSLSVPLAEEELQRLNQTLEQRIEERAAELTASAAKLEETERRFRLLVEGVTD
jgi:hypothetical protein